VKVEAKKRTIKKKEVAKNSQKGNADERPNLLNQE
jgi:hypothetical protein